MAKVISVLVLATVAVLATTTMVSPAMGASGTATFYTPPYTPSSACFGNAAEGTMIAAASEAFWDTAARRAATGTR
ncbi:hypothetical protein SETIT_9G186500v2 [Setaria italica]|uniref:Phytocyanin domain-containing protein n=1 Tax=Setaria italica TaxID=4555 RepID=K4AHJ8_SETIT|nr:hypothetical protein SETIT_9G186500v2 [Setaria italica]